MTEPITSVLDGWEVVERVSPRLAPRRAPRRERTIVRALARRRRWFVGVAVGLLWAWWRALTARDHLINPGGTSQLVEFAAASLRPELSASFLEVIAEATLTTLAYALVGTAVALSIGLVLGTLTSELWWHDDRPMVGTPRRRRWWTPIRVMSSIPRGVHEAVFALGLLQILGRDPLVAVLAIGIPFGAITAKVVGDMIDDAPSGPYLALRQAGASRATSMLYGIAPHVAAPIGSYSAYRFECSIRSAAVLGVIGAGGLGFELALSFQSLRFEQIWTIVYVLVALALVVDSCGAWLRGHGGRRSRRWVFSAALLAVVASARWLAVDISTLWTCRTRELTRSLAAEAWPPAAPSGGWSEMLGAAVDTVTMSIIAISLAVVVAVPAAGWLARRPRRLPAQLGSMVGRLAATVVRSIPSPVWALVVLYVVRPGPMAAGIALGVGTAAVLARLGADAVETADRRPTDALRGAGAGRLQSALYGTMPMLAPRFAGLSVYRWEVTMRESVVVGIVGAGGLGRLLGEQTAAFDEPAMLTTILALLVVAIATDLVGARLRTVAR